MGSMKDLLGDRPYPASPGFTEPTTSKAAAKAIQSRASTLRDRALAHISVTPSTPDEVAAALDETVLAIRPRITELSKMGLIERTGDRRENSSGQKAHVWRKK